MTEFVLVNWVLALGTSAVLLAVVARWRYLLVKPSMQLLWYCNLLLQWPAAWRSDIYERMLPQPWVLVWLLYLPIIPAVAVVATTFHRESRAIWVRITGPWYVERAVSPRLAWLLGVLVILCAVAYLRVVPLEATGLYAIFTNPVGSALARESGLKLLESSAVKYLYFFMALAVAPLLAVSLLIAARAALSRRRWVRLGALVVALFGLLAVVSLGGARSFSVSLLLVLAVAAGLRAGIPFRPLPYFAAALVILAPAVLLSLWREGRGTEAGLFVQYLLDQVAYRVLMLPLETGVQHLHYAQTVGDFGVGGIPRLAHLLGAAPVNVPNIIGLRYSADALVSVNANASFILTYYSYFGLAVLPAIFLGVVATDVAVPLYSRLRDPLLLPTIAAVAVAVLSFAFSDYTVVWLTQGLGPILVLALLINRLVVSAPVPASGAGAR